MAEIGALATPFRPIGTASWLIWRAMRAMALRLVRRDSLAERTLAEAMRQFIWAPLPRLILLAAFVGIIAGVSAAKILSLYNAEQFVLQGVVEAMLRQILPLIIGVFVSGSVSVEVASRLGAMSLANEIDALEAMGRDPVDHALAPPATAILVASPTHMLAATLAAFAGAAVPLHWMANVAWRALLHPAVSNAAASALLTGIAKSFLFSLIALGVGAAIGSRPVDAPADIGRRAGQAFTAGLLTIFAAGALWAALA